ncbi:flagellar hook-associated protein 3 [Aurantivibrio plasticivorans]
MRISTTQIYDIANVGMADAQRAIVKTESQISSGKRVVNPADDPVASTVILQVKDFLARGEQYVKNIDIAENLLELEEVALNGVVSLMQRMRELSVQAGNTAVLTKSDYLAIAAEVDSRLEELLNLANTRSAGGEYIFAGYQGSVEPFVADGGGGYRYVGDEGSISIKVSNIAKIQVSDSGKNIFENIPSPVNTVRTSVNPANQSSPPISISVGQVVDQLAFDDFYPEDMVITFNAQGTVVPPTTNYTITERSSGRVIVQNQLYQPGEDIEVNGVSFRIGGVPYPGTPATPGTVQWGSDAAQNFATDETGDSLTLRVGGITETLTIGSNVTNNADLVTELTTGSNAALLANLGIAVDNSVVPPQFSVASGLNIEVDPVGGSSPNILAALGINSGSVSTNGVPGTPGDTAFIESSNTQGLLTTIARFSDALKQVNDDDNASKDLVADVVSATLESLDLSEININSIQSEIGARLNTLESTRDLQLDSELLNREVLADLEDLDYAEAATRLSLQSFILQATQQSFVRVSGLSLFSIL